MRSAVLIVNPRSGGGRALAAVGMVGRALEQAGYQVTVRETPGPGGAIGLGAESRTADALVTLGGDGTVSEAVHGVLDGGAWPEGLALAPLPLGTGNSFVRHFGPVSGDWRAALAKLLAGETRWVDGASVTWREGTREQRRVCVNVFGTGFMAQVADVTNRRFKRLGGHGYSAGVLWELASLEAPRTRLFGDGNDDPAIDAPLTLVAVCNTQWTGEKMWIAPEASASDGRLDVITLGEISRLGLVRLFPHIFDGSHLSHPAIRTFRCARLRIEPALDGPLLVDGEVLGRTPVEIEVLPGAVQLAM